MKVQIRIQKIICFSALIISAICFVFALGLLHDIYNIHLAIGWGVYMKKDLFLEMQPLNTSLVNSCIALILLAVLLFATLTHKRRNYYITNYISSVLFFGYSLYHFIFSVKNILNCRSRFLTETNFEGYKKITETVTEIKYTESTFWLDINIILSSVALLMGLVVLGNLIWKIILMKKERAFLSSQYIKNHPAEVNE